MIKYGIHQIFLFKQCRKSFSIFQQIKEPYQESQQKQKPQSTKSEQQDDKTKEKNSRYVPQEQKYEIKRASPQGDYYKNRKYTQDKRQENDPQLIEIEKLMDQRSISQQFSMKENQDIIDLLVINAFKYGNIFDGLIKAAQSGLDKLTIHQSESKQVLQFFLCIRLRETVKLADNEMTKKINTYLFRVMLNSDHVEKIHKYFNQMNEITLKDFEQTFCQGGFTQLSPSALRASLHRQVLMSILNLSYRHMLRKEPITEEEVQLMEELLALTYEASFYVKFDWKISYTYIKFLSHYSAKLSDQQHKQVLMKNLNITCQAVTTITENLGDFAQNQLILLMFMVSRMNINQGSIKTYIMFWDKFMKIFEANIESTSQHELKSFYFSLAKVNFITPKIETFLLLKLKETAQNIQGYEPDYSINLLTCTLNLNFYENHKEVLDEFIENYYHHLVQNLSTDRKWRVKIPVQFYTSLIRSQIFETKYWLYFFEIIEEILKSKYRGFKYILVDIIANKSKFSQIIQREIDTNMINNAEVQKLMNQSEQDYQLEHAEENDKFMMEQTIVKYLQNLGVNVEQHKIINNREVDFYLPDLNIALEVMGPHHFIYRESNQTDQNQGKKFTFVNKQPLNYTVEYNQFTKYKINILKEYGYKVKTIDFFDPQNFSFEDLALQLIKD